MLPLPRLTGLMAAVVALTLGACNTDNSFAPADGAPSDVPSGTEADAAAAPIPAPATVGVARILFTSYRDGHQNLYTMDPTGANVFALSKGNGYNTEPSWSWDHKQIAVVRPRWNGTAAPFDIYVMNYDGTNGHWARPFAQNAWGFREPSWSPDGTRILVRIEMGISKYLGWIDVASGAVGFFNPAIEGTGPSYDKAGKRIVYVGKTGKSIDIINADGTGHKIKFSSTTDWNSLHPTFSPDGKKILFERILPDFNRDLFVKDLTTGMLKRLTWNTASDGDGSWSPDGTKIAFTSNRVKPVIPYLYQIYVMNADGSNPIRIKTDSTDWSPAWSH